jgi:phosphatidylinositol-3-phosphatase
MAAERSRAMRAHVPWSASPRRPVVRSLLALMLLLVAVPLGATLLAATPASAAMPSGITTVFLIVMENHDWSSIKGSSSAPYINSLLKRPDAAYASNYHNVPTNTSLHPSEPNYLSLEGATNVYPDHSFTTDSSPSASNSTSSTKHLATLLKAKGIAWAAYQEDISGTNCPISGTGNYTPRHEPFLFFQDVSGNQPSSSNSYCRQHLRPYSQLAGDLSNDRVRGYNFLTPNLCHDMHSNSCSGSSNVVKQGDDWLRANLPTILNSKVYKSGSALVAITWDEGGSGNNPIGMILLSPKTKGNGYTNSAAYTHSSWVKTVEEIFGLSPLVGHAADSSTWDLSAFFKAGTTTTRAAHQAKPHKSHKHHGHGAGHGAALASKTAQTGAHHAKAQAKPAQHGKHGAK